MTENQERNSLFEDLPFQKKPTDNMGKCTRCKERVRIGTHNGGYGVFDPQVHGVEHSCALRFRNQRGASYLEMDDLLNLVER